MQAYSSPSKQSGAALLVFLLLVIVSAATLLVDRLNAGIRSSIYNPETSQQLEEAKTALISWAVNHPVNPGTLPMPDRNNSDGYDGDADCSTNTTVGNSLLLGRIPWRDYPAPACKDAGLLTGLQMNPGTTDIGSDSAGRIPWYAVSHNLIYITPDYPLISPAITNKKSGWITVRDSSGTIISDRVAFVVIAPGPALSPIVDCEGMSYAGQDRSATAPNIGNYLDSVTIGGTTYSNADYDQDFIMYPNSIATNDDSDQERCDQFNDQLEFVTIDELMEIVSRRALNEAANALSAWHTSYDALPWLAPFADPKSDPKPLTGQASSASNNLVDNSVDFTELGVAVGDIVWNLTDGSRAAVTNVAATTLTLGNLRFGSDNTFSVDDEYYVDRRLDSVMRGTASLGSDNVTLEDTTRDFEGAGILPGDIVDNLSDGSSGVIESVDGDELTVAEMTGGAENDFDFNDQYRIRSNQGRATNNTDSNGLTLEDTNANFTRMGVQAGDLVRNISDGSFGYVSTPPTIATQLTVSSLLYGSSNAFANNDYYAITRASPIVNTTSGRLPLHRIGEMFPSGFTIDWNLAGGTIATSLATDSTYTAALSGYAGSSSGYSSTITVPQANAACQWLTDETVRCRGKYEDTTASFLGGTATSGSSSLSLRDSTKNFSTLGAKRGDKIRNLTDGRTGIVFNASSTQLSLVNINGFSSVAISVGDSYQLDLATSSFSFTAQGSTSATRIYYNPAVVDESLFQINDTVENTTLYAGLTSIGRITGVNTGANYISYSVLQGGGYADVYPGEVVRIRHNFVSKREYEFDVTLTGTSAADSTAGIVTRSVCSGYNSTCTTASNNASFKGNGSTAWITIRDYEGSTQVGQATNTLSTGGVVSRSLKLGGMQYMMAEDDVLPDWFVRNNWHQYVMVAYDNGDAPGGTQCTAGTDCISVNVRNAANDILATRDNVRALVMLAGDPLTGQSWGDATADDYFDETENTDTDELFDRPVDSDNYNDVMRIATSCPTDNAILCWSN